MTSASETKCQNFIDDFNRMKPEDQDFIALLLERVAARTKSDPEADRMPATDLFREVIQEIAPERVADFNKWAAGRAA